MIANFVRNWTLVSSVVMTMGCHGSKQAAEPVEEAEPPALEGSHSSVDRVLLDKVGLAALRLTYAKAEIRELSPSLEVSAELIADPDREAEVGARIAGRVMSVPASVGDVVAKGAPVVILESPDAGKARSEWISAGARAEVARSAWLREKDLLEKNVASRKDLEEAEGAHRIAEADLAAAKTLLASLGIPESEASRSKDPAQVVLRSPIAGTVVSRTAHIGQTVEPKDTLIEVIDLDKLWLSASVYEKDMRLVAKGKPVQIGVRAYPDEVFKGIVDRVGDTLDEKTRTVAVRVILENPGHRLKPGMFANARIEGAHDHPSRPMLAVPWSAVQQVDEHNAVFVHAGERGFELRRVHTGERSGDLVEVLNGLQEGDEVVTNGSFLLKGVLLKSTLGEAE